MNFVKILQSSFMLESVEGRHPHPNRELVSCWWNDANRSVLWFAGIVSSAFSFSNP